MTSATTRQSLVQGLRMMMLDQPSSVFEDEEIPARVSAASGPDGPVPRGLPGRDDQARAVTEAVG